MYLTSIIYELKTKLKQYFALQTGQSHLVLGSGSHAPEKNNEGNENCWKVLWKLLCDLESESISPAIWGSSSGGQGV